mgnify:CR=1 FL=1
MPSIAISLNNVSIMWVSPKFHSLIFARTTVKSLCMCCEDNLEARLCGKFGIFTNGFNFEGKEPSITLVPRCEVGERGCAD